MKLHVGRLIDHIHLRVADLDKSRAFYKAVLESLGRELTFDYGTAFGSDELFIDKADGYISKVHLAFQTDGPEMVQRAYEAGLAAGGTDNGAPGERNYHPSYYGAFLLDPDGNNIEAVHHGEAKRSAPSVKITF